MDIRLIEFFVIDTRRRPVETVCICIYACVSTFTAINSEPQTPAQNIDYNFAREELMLNELSNDPIQRAIARLEKQHEEDKQVLEFSSEEINLIV